MQQCFLESGVSNDLSANTLAQLIGGMLTMLLYGAIQKVEPQDDGTVRVHGIASSEVVDDQGEIVRADAGGRARSRQCYEDRSGDRCRKAGDRDSRRGARERRRPQ